MKTVTTTTSMIVQQREEDQDRDAIKGKKINDTVLWVPLCQPAKADVFSVVASILSIRKVTFRVEKSGDRKYVYSRGFLCAKPRLFCKLLCRFLFFNSWGRASVPRAYHELLQGQGYANESLAHL